MVNIEDPDQTLRSAVSNLVYTVSSDPFFRLRKYRRRGLSKYTIKFAFGSAKCLFACYQPISDSPQAINTYLNNPEY